MDEKKTYEILKGEKKKPRGICVSAAGFVDENDIPITGILHSGTIKGDPEHPAIQSWIKNGCIKEKSAKVTASKAFSRSGKR